MHSSLFDEESRNEFRQKYHSMGLKKKRKLYGTIKGIHESNATKKDLKSLLQHWGKMEALGMMEILGIDLES